MWLITPQWDLIWFDMLRFQKEIPDILPAVRSLCQQYKPEWIGIENNGLGIGVFQTVARAGLPVKALSPHSGDKLVRATDACNRMERGKIWLPERTPLEHMQGGDWLDDCQAELFTWTGHPKEQADQIDTLAYAALELTREATSTPDEQQFMQNSYPGMLHLADLPSAV